MTETTPAPARKKSSPWLRRLLIAGGGVVVLLVVVYFVVTSGAFFKGIILPRIGKAMNAQVTVVDARISPFSQVVLQGLKVTTTGAEPLLSAEEVRLSYSLMAILGGDIRVSEVIVSSPVIQVVKNADGTSNLDPLSKQETQPTPARTTPSGKPPRLEIRNVALKNATVRFVTELKQGGRQVAELSHLHLTLDKLQNGQAGRLTVQTLFAMTQPTNDLLQAESTTQIEFALGADLLPQSIKAVATNEVLKAEGTLRELAGLKSTIDCELTPTELKKFSQEFSQGGHPLGALRISGPLDLAKKEGRLKLEAGPLDNKLLNRLGSAFGLDFGLTTMDAVTEVEFAKGGTLVTLTGQFNAAKFTIAQKGVVTPSLDLKLAWNATIHVAEGFARIETLSLDGMQGPRPLLQGKLTRPMTVAWGKTGGAAEEAAFEMKLNELNLADWRAFTGETVSGGRLQLTVNVASAQSGRQLKLDLDSRIDDLSIKLGTTPLTQASLTAQVRAQVDDFTKFQIHDYKLNLRRQQQPALSLSGSASYDGSTIALQTKLEAVMAQLLGSGPATPLAASIQLKGTMRTNVFSLQQLQLALSPTTLAPKNELVLSGEIDSSSQQTKANLVLNSETLDLTPYYDAFADRKTEAAPDAKPAGTPGAPTEPEPTTLPLRQSTVNAKIGRLHLREIAASNVVMNLKMDGGRVTMSPLQLTLNGAPFKAEADLNLAVKGYTYSLSAQADRIPLEPIANSFSQKSRGNYKGQVLANITLKGAGITDANLRKNLSGDLGLTFTNANITLLGPKMRSLMLPIAALLRVSDLTESPLNWVDAKAEIGAGNIQLSRLAVQSSVFEARMQGAIPMAEVLTNSPLNLPVEFSLRRSLAEKASLLPADAPTNAVYVRLPQFVTVKGTLGAPKSDLNERALGGMLVKSGLGIAEKAGVKLDGKTGDILKGVGSLLEGSKHASTNAASTNAAGTNQPKFNPFDLLKKK